MKIDVAFYLSFLAWVEKKGATVATSNPTLLPSFLSDVTGVFRGLFAMITDFLSCLRGGFLGTAFNISRWVSNNPDPLANCRAAIRALYAKWGA